MTNHKTNNPRGYGGAGAPNFWIACSVYAVLEVAWLYLARPFYKSQFAKFSRDGSLMIRSYLAIALVYPLLLISAWIFTRHHTVLGAAWRGALFGAVVYGVYNLTNMATLPGYSWPMVIVDTCWGATIFTIFAVVGAWMPPQPPRANCFVFGGYFIGDGG